MLFGVSKRKVAHIKGAIKHAAAKVVSYYRCNKGAIAVEFAVTAPFLVILTLAVFMWSKRTMIVLDLEQIVRAGAEIALQDPGMDAVRGRMMQAAIAKGYTKFDDPNTSTLPYDTTAIGVVRRCECPGDVVEADCTTSDVCPNAGKPGIISYGLFVTYQSDHDLWMAGNGLFNFVAYGSRFSTDRRVIVR